VSSNERHFPGWVRAVHAVSRALGVFSVGLIVLAVMVVCQMVFVRAVLGQSTVWQTEFTTFSVLGATFLGAPYILLTRGHVGVDILPMMVDGVRRRLLYLLSSLIAFFFCSLFLYAAIPWWHEAWQSGQTTATIWRARLWIPYACVPIGLAVLCAQYVAEVYLVLFGRAEPYGLARGVNL
jgi:TRAP-type C4-dicarboxylate transport system permease small subunit